MKPNGISNVQNALLMSVYCAQRMPSVKLLWLRSLVLKRVSCFDISLHSPLTATSVPHSTCSVRIPRVCCGAKQRMFLLTVETFVLFSLIYTKRFQECFKKNILHFFSSRSIGRVWLQSYLFNWTWKIRPILMFFSTREFLHTVERLYPQPFKA
jgi:hypothetical protein